MFSNNVSPPGDDRKDYVSQMSIRDKVLLGPVEKWRRYRVLPLRELLHVILIILTTWQVVVVNSRQQSYIRSCGRNWSYFFMPPDYDFADDVYYIYQYQNAIDSVETAVTGYYTINDTSVDYYGYKYLGGMIQPPRLTVTSYSFVNDTDINTDPHETIQTQYNVLETEYYLQPGDFTELVSGRAQVFFDNLLTMHLDFDLSNYAVLASRAICYIWHIDVEYDFSSRGHLSLTVDSNISGYCARKPALFDIENWDDLMWIAVITIFFSLLFTLFFIAHLFKTWRLYLAILGSEGAQIWKGLPLMKRLRLFNPWFFVSFFATVLITLSCVLYIVGQTTPLFTDLYMRSATLGAGCGILWVCLVKYLSHDKSYYAMIMTLYRGAPRIAQFVAGVIPIFMGYVFCGITLFGNYSDSFASVKVACVTLFALLNGDIVRDSFQALYTKFPVSSQLFLYSFICLFIYVALNICIVIIEETFYAVTPTKSIRSPRGIRSIDPNYDATNRSDADALTTMLQMLERQAAEAADESRHASSVHSDAGDNKPIDNPLLESLIDEEIISLSALNHDVSERELSSAMHKYNPPAVTEVIKIDKPVISSPERPKTARLSQIITGDQQVSISLQTRLKQELAGEYSDLLRRLSNGVLEKLENDKERTERSFKTELEAHEWACNYALVHFSVALKHVEEKVLEKLGELLDEHSEEKKV